MSQFYRCQQLKMFNISEIAVKVKLRAVVKIFDYKEKYFKGEE